MGLGRVNHVGTAGQLCCIDAPFRFGNCGLVAVVLGDGIVKLRLGDPSLAEQRARPIKVVVGLLQHGLRLLEGGLQYLNLVGPLQLRLGVGKSCFGLVDAGLGGRDRGLLLRAFQREDWVALFDVVAFFDA